MCQHWLTSLAEGETIPCPYCLRPFFRVKVEGKKKFKTVLTHMRDCMALKKCHLRSCPRRHLNVEDAKSCEHEQMGFVLKHPEAENGAVAGRSPQAGIKSSFRLLKLKSKASVNFKVLLHSNYQLHVNNPLQLLILLHLVVDIRTIPSIELSKQRKLHSLDIKECEDDTKDPIHDTSGYEQGKIKHNRNNQIISSQSQKRWMSQRRKNTRNLQGDVI